MTTLTQGARTNAGSNVPPSTLDPVCEPSAGDDEALALLKKLLEEAKRVHRRHLEQWETLRPQREQAEKLREQIRVLDAAMRNSKQKVEGYEKAIETLRPKHKKTPKQVEAEVDKQVEEVRQHLLKMEAPLTPEEIRSHFGWHHQRGKKVLQTGVRSKKLVLVGGKYRADQGNSNVGEAA